MIPSFFRVRVLEETASTNEDLKQAALAGEDAGLVIKAKRQTAGKGRQGRTWNSPEGNLYVSVLLRPEGSVQEVGLFSFVTALAVHQAVTKTLPTANVKLKWPNDVLVNGKKIGGILLESSGAENGSLDWLVIGVGVNVASHPDSDTTLYPTTSLAAEGGEAEVDDVLEAFLNGLDQWRLTLNRDGFRHVRRSWLAHAQAGAMTVRLPKREIQGHFSGIDEKGRLILRLANGEEESIDSGDVFFS